MIETIIENSIFEALSFLAGVVITIWYFIKDKE